MKNFHRLTKGVTLLEVMLVLTIISIIVVASMRYYKTASDNSQAQAAVGALQAIAAAADTYVLQNTNSAGGYTGLTVDNLPSYLKATQWGGALAVPSASVNVKSFAVTYASVSTSLCTTITGMLTNTKWTAPCPEVPGPVTFTYVN